MTDLRPLLREWRDDPPRMMREWLGVELLPWQERALKMLAQNDKLLLHDWRNDPMGSVRKYHGWD